MSKDVIIAIGAAALCLVLVVVAFSVGGSPSTPANPIADVGSPTTPGPTGFDPLSGFSPPPAQPTAPSYTDPFQPTHTTSDPMAPQAFPPPVSPVVAPLPPLTALDTSPIPLGEELFSPLPPPPPPSVPQLMGQVPADPLAPPLCPRPRVS